jgi:AcrR family transcriptional regulator
MVMMSSPSPQRVRKPPHERRAEIVDEAAKIALADGLERITLRAVAERLGVRPGLISHYFPAVETLVGAAFVLAVAQEREDLIPAGGDPLSRMAHMIERVEGDSAVALARLWLNARHLCRFSPHLAEVLEEQEHLYRERLMALIEEGVASGHFATGDSFRACVRILVAMDGVGAYANSSAPFPHESFTRFVTDVAEWALGVPDGQLHRAVDSVRSGAGAS